MPFEVFLLIPFLISPLVSLPLCHGVPVDAVPHLLPSLGTHTPSPVLCVCDRHLFILSSLAAPSGRTAAPSLRHFTALMMESFPADGNRLTQSPHKALERPALLARPWASGRSWPRLLFASLLSMQNLKFQPKFLPSVWLAGLKARPQIPAQIPPQHVSGWIESPCSAFPNCGCPPALQFQLLSTGNP